MTGNELRALAYGTIVRDEGCNPEYISEFCKVLLLAERRPAIGQYDDRITLITPELEKSWPGNTQPARLGWNATAGKNMAVLRPGVWPLRSGPHNGRPGNARQLTPKEAAQIELERFFDDTRAQGSFTVDRTARDGTTKPDTGLFHINLHQGGSRTVSSAGCMTLHPAAWAEFQPMLYGALGKYNQLWPAGWLPLVLVEA